MNKKIEFCKHNLSSEDISKLSSIARSLFLTTGEVVKEFERKFAAYLNAQYAVGVTSCTDALELCLRYFDIGPGDEVITTPLSFVATAQAIEYVGATPVFVDVEKDTGNIDIALIEQKITNSTKAIIPVHLYGQMCDMKALIGLAGRYGLKIIEDAAHCVEGERDSVRPGALGDAACFSFYATKNLTCGEGGAVVCNDGNMYEWLVMARHHGITKNAADRYTKKFFQYDVNFLGRKCNMSNLQAALLVHQLDHLDEYWHERKELALQYNELLRKVAYKVGLPVVLNAVKHAWHLYVISVQRDDDRDEIIKFFQERNIGVAVHYKPIHLLSYYQQQGYALGDFPVAECWGKRVLSLPFYPKLQREELYAVVKTLECYGANQANVQDTSSATRAVS